MPKGTKRTTAAREAAADKKPKMDPHAVAVEVGIQMHTALPESVKSMLVSCIPNGLQAPSDERNDTQQMAVGMLGEAMEEVKAQLEQAVDVEAAKVAEIEAAGAGLDAGVEATESSLASVGEEVKEKTRSLAAAASAARDAAAALENVVASQREVGKEHDEAKSRLQAMEDLLVEHFRPLSDGSGDGAQHYAALAPLLEASGSDASLVSTLPTVCATPPEQRGTFGAVAIEQLGKILEEKIASSRAAVDAGEAAAQERAAAIDAARAQAEEADKPKGSLAEELAAAQQRERDAVDAAAKAKAAVAEHEPGLQAAKAAHAHAAEALENFVSYNIACFEVLRDARRVPLEQPKVSEEQASTGNVAAEAGA